MIEPARLREIIFGHWNFETASRLSCWHDIQWHPIIRNLNSLWAFKYDFKSLPAGLNWPRDNWYHRKESEDTHPTWTWRTVFEVAKPAYRYFSLKGTSWSVSSSSLSVSRAYKLFPEFLCRILSICQLGLEIGIMTRYSEELRQLAPRNHY